MLRRCFLFRPLLLSPRYYLILITKRRIVGHIGTHCLYKIEDTSMIQVWNPENPGETHHCPPFHHHHRGWCGAVTATTTYSHSQSQSQSRLLNIHATPVLHHTTCQCQNTAHKQPAGTPLERKEATAAYLQSTFESR